MRGVSMARVCLSLALVVVAVPCRADPAYTVEDLGAADVQVKGVDAYGVAYGSRGSQAVLFTPSVIPLGALPGSTSAVVLSRDPVTGNVGNSSTGPEGLHVHAFLNAAGRATDLGNIGAEDAFSTATGIAGRIIVGWGDDTRHDPQPLIWYLGGGGPQLLPTLGGLAGTAAGTTRTGVVVGQSETVARELHATIWILGLAFDLTPGAGTLSQANAITESLMVVGQLNGHAWRWTPQHGSEDLGVLPGDDEAELVAVNPAGTAVGFRFLHVDPGAFPSRAIRTNGTELQDLNTLIADPHWLLEGATGITPAGVIVGHGLLRGHNHSFLLRPLPPALASR